MVIDQTGNASVRTAKFGGQKVIAFDQRKKMVFILRKGVMHSAGSNQTYGGGWPEMVRQGRLSSEGIGLNPKLWTKAWKAYEKGYDFIVYDKTEEMYYILDNLEIINEHGKLEKIDVGKKQIPLYLTPLDAYEKQNNADVPKRVEKV